MVRPVAWGLSAVARRRGGQGVWGTRGWWWGQIGNADAEGGRGSGSQRRGVGRLGQADVMRGRGGRGAAESGAEKLGGVLPFFRCYRKTCFQRSSLVVITLHYTLNYRVKRSRRHLFNITCVIFFSRALGTVGSSGGRRRSLVHRSHAQSLQELVLRARPSVRCDDVRPRQLCAIKDNPRLHIRFGRVEAVENRRVHELRRFKGPFPASSRRRKSKMPQRDNTQSGERLSHKHPPLCGVQITPGKGNGELLCLRQKCCQVPGKTQRVAGVVASQKLDRPAPQSGQRRPVPLHRCHPLAYRTPTRVQVKLEDQKVVLYQQQPTAKRTLDG